VRHGGELLGLLVLQEKSHEQLTPVEERLFAGLADHAGLVLRNAALRVELERQAVELSDRADELRTSRQRFVDAHDAERERLERDIHDGAQQHLVALAVNLQLALTLSGSSPERADALLEKQASASVTALETVDQLSRGIYPSALSDGGLAAALRSAAEASPVPVQVVSSGIDSLPSPVAAAAYFFCLEAMQNAAKHAGATTIRVELETAGEQLRVDVEDDGAGFDVDSVRPGVGMTNMRDRLEALDGRLVVASTSRGTRVRALVPVVPEA
jgi:signal transduction histidine kinase